MRHQTKQNRTGNRAVRWTAVLLTAVLALGLLVAGRGSVSAKPNKNTYRIKVNRKANVVTVYQKKKGKYRAIRAMRVSCGKAKTKNNTTPKGTFRLKDKHNWGLLYGNVWGRITMTFYRDYLFHTVPYQKKGNAASMNVAEYKKLGKNASGGCVRMQYIDLKWLRKTCPVGTRVTVYSSKRPGPLGRPGVAPLKTGKKYYYDPTDPSGRNKAYSLRAPVLDINKTQEIEYGTTFRPAAGVTARDSRTFQNLTSRIKYTIYRQSEDGWIRVNAVDTRQEEAVYRINYRCKYTYCSKKTGLASMTFHVGKNPQEPSPEPDPASEAESGTTSEDTESQN